ncbi:MAG: AAA family ATPase [Caldimicrobium sp.]|nr:AAA family ATPase [Caldimicrobium sp.]MCX7614041.1 AAA family ATPase [Caldimicrobium sp.]MDW8182353.1 AAA family ATPase [Caldimicrobium sp.]
MKIALCGKGGVGKSSLASLLILSFLHAGYKVLAIDADPSPHLARLLEIPQEVTPLAEMMDLLAERAQKSGPYYTLNPKIDDLPEKFAITKDGLRLMVLGAIRTAGGGCACPEQTVLKRLLTYLLLTSKEVVLVDMEAGVEHFGRASVTPMDVLLVITQPLKGSIETTRQILKLAKELGLERVYVIGNKVRTKEQEELLQGEFGDRYLLSFPPDEELERREFEGRGLWTYRGVLFSKAQELREKLTELLHEIT